MREFRYWNYDGDPFQAFVARPRSWAPTVVIVDRFRRDSRIIRLV
ncbi:hypothetical protein SAMN04487963_2387 [Marinobacter zhejiangensis]|uniref:Uncharacterized protein n=1 Tax=Marinobacter zhejiangensis TaxID=488535 RepID=A0A1I4QI45_9GAMM|nr:hypothetical protein SAMN04487963_2387 [Marinobacter zhejiangensis]